jgi:hypothetical protein
LKAVLGRKGPILLKEDPEGNKEKTLFYGWPEGTDFTALTEAKALEFVESLKGPSQWGSFQGSPIVVKKGPHGYYAQAGGINVKVVDGDTAETLQQKFEEKTKACLHTLGEFEFRQGQFGPFMYKKPAKGKKPVFVSLPQNLDPKILTLEAAEQLYQNGMQKKPSGRGGGGRGRGRGRGRGTA